MSMTTLAHGIGKGLLAGVVGPPAMTLSSTIQRRVRNRQVSNAPAEAAKKVLGIEEFQSDAAEERFSNLVHWGYGTAWGALRGLLGAAGLGRRSAGIAHLAAIWGSALVLLPTLDVAPPVTMRDRREVAIDLWHHVVYMAATRLAYEWLDCRQLGVSLHAPSCRGREEPGVGTLGESGKANLDEIVPSAGATGERPSARNAPHPPAHGRCCR
jgi:hypothetical protein